MKRRTGEFAWVKCSSEQAERINGLVLAPGDFSQSFGLVLCEKIRDIHSMSEENVLYKPIPIAEGRLDES